VNSHEELVDALQYIAKQNKWDSPNTLASCIDKAKQALKKAGA
jgi:hypothetical protein